MPEQNAGIQEMSVEQFNAAVEAEESAPMETAPDAASIEEIETEAAAEATVEGETVEEVAPESKTDKPTETAEADDFTFTENADAETRAREESEYLETLDVPAPLQAMLDRRFAEIERLNSVVGVVEVNGGSENVGKIFGALNKLFEQDEPGRANAAPLVELLRADYSSELPSIAEELFVAPSVKYQGLSMFQEVLMDVYKTTPQKLDEVNRFLSQPDYQLPAPVSPTPAGVDAKLREAYSSLPEIKRFEIESLSNEILTLQKDLAETEDSYDRDVARTALDKAQARLNAEVETLQDRQENIEGKKRAETYAQQQRIEAAQKFETRVVESYNAEVFGLMDAFASELAPRLTFLDETQQKPMANSILSRVQNALAFEYDGETFVNSPTAEYYAKQLKSEGIDYDFGSGRALLQKHLAATRRVEVLKANNAGIKAVEHAENLKRNIMQDIKLEERALLGKITSRFVKSSSKAIDDKVKNISDKKQIARRIITGQQPATKVKNQSVDEIRGEIRQFNRAIQEGDLESIERQYA